MTDALIVAPRQYLSVTNTQAKFNRKLIMNCLHLQKVQGSKHFYELYIFPSGSVLFPLSFQIY